jgi:hypothetical protein
MTRLAFSLLALAGVVLAPGIHGSTAGLPPTAMNTQSDTTVLYMDVMPPPTTLRSLWDESSAVVHATVKSTSLPRRDPRSSPEKPMAIRLQVLTVLEVLKQHDSRPIGAEVVVKQFGGTLVVNGREIRTVYAEAVFNVGEELILFLDRASDEGEYPVRYADAGAFKIDPASRHVRVPKLVSSRMPALSDRASIALAEFLDTLRALRERAPIPF